MFVTAAIVITLCLKRKLLVRKKQVGTRVPPAAGCTWLAYST